MTKRHSWLIALLLLGCRATAPTPPPATPAADSSAPTMRPAVRRIDATALQVRLTRRAEHTAVYAVFATWCAPCQEEIPALAELARRRPELRVTLVDVDHPVILDAAVAAFVDSLGASELELLRLVDEDPPGVLARTIPGWADAIPVTTFVPPTGPAWSQTGLAQVESLIEAVDSRRRP